MGIGGYHIIRFRGRYYCFYNYQDSYPDGLNAVLIHEIPDDPEKYQKRLVKQRVKASKWDFILENFLHVNRVNAGKPKNQNLVD